MKDVKADAEFRQNLVQVMRESNEAFSNSIKEISKSMTVLSKSMCSSMELLANSLRPTNGPPPQQHIPQNIYFNSISSHPVLQRLKKDFHLLSHLVVVSTQYLNDDNDQF